MKRDSSGFSTHLSGEQSQVVTRNPASGVDVDSFFGPVRVEWDHEAALTPPGKLPFFIHFPEASGLFDALVADCPLRYRSPNAPRKRDVLGTAMLSMFAGHKRYAHIAALRCDSVLPDRLLRQEAQNRLHPPPRSAPPEPSLRCPTHSGPRMTRV